MNKILLKLMSLLNPLWVSLGVNTDQLYHILEAKLTMDDRRSSAFTLNRHRQKKAPNRSTVITMIFSLIMGCFYLVVFNIPADILFQMTIYFFMYMVLLAVTLISDFTYVLIDVKDNYIILPRPVNDRTFVISRLMHIFIHTCKIIVPMTIPGLIFLIVQYGPAGLLFIPLIILSTLLTIFMINAVYLLILKITTPDRFKGIINYVQIFFSILVFAIYYLVPQLISKSIFTHVDILSYKFFYFTPPLWFAACWKLCTHPQQNQLLILFSILAVIIPLLSIMLVVKYLAPAFNRKLTMIGSGSETKPRRKSKVSTVGFYQRIARIFTRGEYERAGFELVWLLTGRNRDFKLKVYPGFAYVIIYFFFIGMQGKGSLTQRWDHLGQTKSYVLVIYFSSFAMITAIRQLIYSDKFKAAWIYYSSPLKQPGALLTGAFKAVVVKYFLPFFLAVVIFVSWIWHAKVLPDLLLGFVNVCLIGIVMCFVFLKQMPFSAAPDIQGNAGNFIKNLFIMIGPVFLGFIHYMVTGMLWAMLLIFILVIILLWMIMSKYRELAWSDLEKS
jgi:ABC-2 type transport system permease protein